MCEEIFQSVLEHRYLHIYVTLNGYRRSPVRGQVYPALLRDEAASVEGILYLDLDDQAWTRLDHFEGAMYQRENVEVETVTGDRLPATTYVIRPEHDELLDQGEWSFAEFLETGKSRFLPGDETGDQP